MAQRTVQVVQRDSVKSRERLFFSRDFIFCFILFFVPFFFSRAHYLEEVKLSLTGDCIGRTFF